MSHSRTGSLGSLRKHPQYYFEMGDLHVLAQRTLFRIHGYFFIRDSVVFNKKLNPASPGEVKEGATDTDPIVLEDVSAEDFATFLWVFYNPKYSLYDASVDKWRTILHLANQWQFHQAKELAVRELHKKDLRLVEKLALYQDYKVDNKHLIPLYAELAKQDRPITLDEARILGMEATVMINTARERLRADPASGGLSPLPQGLEDSEVEREIASIVEEFTPPPSAIQEETLSPVSPSKKAYLSSSFTSSINGRRPSPSHLDTRSTTLQVQTYQNGKHHSSLSRKDEPKK